MSTEWLSEWKLVYSETLPTGYWDKHETVALKCYVKRGDVNPFEHCFFKATFTDTVKHQEKDPTIRVTSKNSDDFIRERNTTKKCSC